MRRLAVLPTIALLPACKGGTKEPATRSSVVVISVDGHDVTEDDTSLSFGEACVQNADVPPSTRSLVIKNPGLAPLTLGLGLSGPNAASFTLSPPVPTSVAPASQVQIDVQFAPRTGGAQSASLDVTTNDAVKPTVHVRLTGIGASKLPKPSYATTCTDGHGGAAGPDSCLYLTFPDTAVGTVGTQTLHVTNNGCPPLQLTGITLISDPSNQLADGGAPFRFHGSAPTAASPLKLGTGESADLAFEFLPTGNTLFNADLYVQTNGVHDPQFTHQGFFPDGGALTDDTFYVGLSGQGLAGQVGLTPPTCDFNQTDGGQGCGAHLVNSAGDVAGTFTLQNAGNATVQVTSVGLDTDGGVFTVSSPGLPGPLAGGSTAAIAVTYHPINGQALAHLQVVTDLATLSSTLVGGNPPVILLRPSELSFNDGGIPDSGVADPATLAPTRSFTVGNSGTGLLSVRKVSFLGSNSDGGCDGFSVQAPAFPFTVAPGSSKDVSLLFTRDRHSGGVVRCETHVLSNDLVNTSPLVNLYASSFVNCDPIADFVPSGAVNFQLAGDGGVYVIDGSTSFDTDDSTTPRCTNGLSDGISAFEWTLVRTNSARPASTTHLEPPAGVASCPAAAPECATCLRRDATSQKCVTLRVSTTNVFSPGSAALVNLVLDPMDARGVNAWDLSLVVTDGSGRPSTASNTLQIFGQ